MAHPRDDTQAADRANVSDAFLLEVVRRWQLLAALQAAPASSSELTERVDLSRSTVHRATDALTELNLIEKSDGTFSLTSYGKVVTEKTRNFREQMEATQLLAPFLSYVDVPGFPVEYFVDADVIEPKPRQPHYSVRRIIELIEGTEYLRVFSTVISPFYVEVAHREMLNGMRAEAIFDQQTIDIILQEYGQETQEAAEVDRFEVYVHDAIPFELFLFDERIGIAAHDDDGIARVLVVSSSERAYEWGEQLYAEYLSDAHPVTG